MNARRDTTSKNGQALVELAVALIVIVVLLAALLQIGRLTREHMDALNAARGDAAQSAMASVYTMRIPAPRFLRDWDAGADGARHSRDDTPRDGDPAGVVRHIAEKALPDELERRVSGNPVTALARQVPLIGEYHLVYGRSETRTIELLPVVRHLLYDAESIDIEADAWLVWTQGLY
jgi:hypothetical protein